MLNPESEWDLLHRQRYAPTTNHPLQAYGKSDSHFQQHVVGYIAPLMRGLQVESSADLDKSGTAYNIGRYPTNTGTPERECSSYSHMTRENEATTTMEGEFKKTISK